MKHLRISWYDIAAAGNPPQLMRDLGIWYFISVPHTISDHTDFWCCMNVPDKLPPFITERGSPEGPGYGLTKQQFEIIKKMEEQFVVRLLAVGEEVVTVTYVRVLTTIIGLLAASVSFKLIHDKDYAGWVFVALALAMLFIFALTIKSADED